MRGRIALVVACALTMLSCSFVELRSLHKQVRASIAPFAVRSTPFEILTSRRAFRSLVARYPLSRSNECATAVSAVLSSCDFSRPCNFDVLESALRTSCGTTLADGAADPGGPRLQRWIVDMLGAALTRARSTDVHEGTFAYDLSAYLATKLDFDELDASVRQLVAAVPVRLELRRVYARPKDLLGKQAGILATLLAMPELRAITMSEVDLRTARPDESGLATPTSAWLDASRYAGCIPDQPRFVGLVDMKVRVAAFVPSSSTSAVVAASSEGALLVEAAIPRGSSEACAIVASSRAAVDVAPYLADGSREIDVRIELETPLPVTPPGRCDATRCETTIAYVGGYAWLDVAFANLDARALAAVIAAFRAGSSPSPDAGTD